MELDILKGKKVAELREIAAALKIEGAAKLKKSELIAIFTRMHEETVASGAMQEGPAEKPDTQAPAEEVKAGAEEAKAEAAPEAKPAKKRGRKPKAVKEAEAAAEAAENAKQIIAETAAEIKPEAPAEAAEEQAEKPEAQDAKPEEKTEEKADGAAEEQKQKDDNRYEVTGILDIAEGGFGFLRFDNFLTSSRDVYVSPTQIRRFNLKTGDEICGVARKPNPDERFGALLYVRTVNEDEPGVAKRRRDFSDLTPIYPNERICLEKGSSTLSMRLTDLVAPIGKGQRGLIVAPPKAGKTTLLKQIAKAIEAQDLNVKLIVLLIDERPEEVTDMKESIKGDVIYSTFDEQPSHHVKVAEMVLERAERLCEHGKDVVILMDSITRLARAYNLVEPPSGRTLSGGLDPAALYKPKKFFGAARNTREGGSITILATALIETGSRMDDMIFEEFKGTGNMELHLDRRLQEKRIFPAININKTGTRREDMLMSPEELEAVWLMRRAVADWGVEEATEKIVFDLVHTKSNRDFIQRFLKTRV
ncbi:MAG: transcription termination factor Rho [Firmicutes bacterium]|nr:transcription termination factor Rho [Bacillota bacterium]